MLSIVHISDTHVRRRAHPNAENEHLRTIVDQLLAHQERSKRTNMPSEYVVVHTGDLTDNGEDEEYELATELLRPLVRAGFHVLACPGNHDCGSRGTVYQESRHVGFQRRVLGDLIGIAPARAGTNEMPGLYPLVHRIGGATFVGLDSMLGRAGAGELSTGYLGDGQRARLEALLAAHPAGTPLVVYLHHHPFDRGFGLQLHDAAKLMDLLAGRADLLLFGHKHVEAQWDAASPHRIGLICAAGKSTAPYPDRWPVREIFLWPDGTTRHRFPIAPPGA